MYMRITSTPSRAYSNFPKDHQLSGTAGAGKTFAQQKITRPEVMSCGGRRGHMP